EVGSMTRSHSSTRRVRLSSRFSTKVLATALAITMLLPLHHAEVSAQTLPPLDCGVNGFCISGSLTNLLGLPNGTLKIVGYQPWDYVLQSPGANDTLKTEWQQAAAAWQPLEADARAGLSAIHGVPNDFRLPHFADDEMRAQIFMRLLTLAHRKSNNETLTGP